MNALYGKLYVHHFFRVESSQFLQVFRELVVVAEDGTSLSYHAFDAICLSACAFHESLRALEILGPNPEGKEKLPNMMK